MPSCSVALTVGTQIAAALPHAKVASATVDQSRCCIGHPLLDRLGGPACRGSCKGSGKLCIWGAVKSLPQGFTSVHNSSASRPPSLQMHKHVLKKKKTDLVQLPAWFLPSHLEWLLKHWWDKTAGNDAVWDPRANHCTRFEIYLCEADGVFFSSKYSLCKHCSV